MEYKIYRVRRGFGGKSILQVAHNGPSFNGGQVDSSIRVLYWSDVKYNSAPATLMAIALEKGILK